MGYYFTSESVSAGHPDKVADQISDAVLDAILSNDPASKVACETLVTTGLVVVAGEIRTNGYVEIPDVARKVIEKIGYNKSEYQFELVLGLPASGKSTRIVDPDSEAMGAFILDPDVIKAELPEYKESHGAGADAIHFEGMNIFNEAIKAFTEGDMKGVNAILPIVSSDLDDLMETYIRPFEAAGYNVKVKFKDAEPNEAAARVVMRELRGGQLINSAVAFSFGYGPEEVYNELASMINSNGEPYGYDVEEALAPAA